jgi:arginyl-tRNA synthetase
MKSREGTVVDADDLMQNMVDAAKALTESLGKLEGMEKDERAALYEHIGMAALKYFLLKVDPRKNMLFNPEESIDFNGHTGPFIQYAHARIQSLIAKYGQPVSTTDQSVALNSFERNLHLKIYQYPATIDEAASTYNPAVLANYIFELVKEFSSFYQNVSILNADEQALIDYRIQLVSVVARIVKSGMNLLGIQVPERM